MEGRTIVSIEVVKPGLLTTVQDLGRMGVQRYGVVAGGAADSFAHRIANVLAGNEEGVPTLEMTGIGATLRFQEDVLIALCGADMNAEVDGLRVPLWRPVYLRSGEMLHCGSARSGFRTYMAVAGGIRVPSVMGSGSTDLRARIGGYQGRALTVGDHLEIGEATESAIALAEKLAVPELKRAVGTAQVWRAGNTVDGTGSAYEIRAPRWFVSSELLPDYADDPVIRSVRGPEFEQFNGISRERFFSESYQVTPHSDRMGYRLSGPLLELDEQREMLTEPVAYGTVQVPAGGEPIVLMADRQTTGGYPRIAQIIHVDLPIIAQSKPGSTIRFQELSVEAAQELYILRELEIRRLRQAVRMWARKGD